jgi:hypothetical protein
MSKTIKPEDLGAAIERELTLYGKAVQAGVDDCGRRAIRKLVKRTQETAPLGERRGGNFAASIASKELKGIRGSRFLWFVKSPNHRLTHLIVKGHLTKNGDRTKANPFLSNALDVVLPEYEEEIKEVLANGK